MYVHIIDAADARTAGFVIFCHIRRYSNKEEALQAAGGINRALPINSTCHSCSAHSGLWQGRKQIADEYVVVAF